MDESFICATCSQEHPGLPTDYAFGLPDDVFALSYIERYLRSRSNPDLCTLDEARFFIRGVLPLPFSDSEGYFGLGMWVEVTKDEHDLYVEGFYEDLSDNPRFSARLANHIPGYDTSETHVDVQFRAGGDRPTFHLSPGAPSPLASEQHIGITRDRHHKMLENFGFFD